MIPFLEVNRAELAEGLKSLRKFIKPTSPAEAVISFQDDRLRIDLVGMAARASATGTWPGQARVSTALIWRLAQALPTGDPLPLRVEGGHIYIAQDSAPCTWQDASGKGIPLPINPSLLQLLNIRRKHAEDVIRQSGLTALVRDAEKQRDALIAKAVAILGPLEIQPAGLRRIVDERLTREEGT